MCKEFRDWPPCGGCGGAVSVEDGILSVDHDAADEVLRALRQQFRTAGHP